MPHTASCTHRCRTFFFILLFAAVACGGLVFRGPALADNRGILPLSEAIQEALAHNPDLILDRREWELARERLEDEKFRVDFETRGGIYQGDRDYPDPDPGIEATTRIEYDEFRISIPVKYYQERPGQVDVNVERTFFDDLDLSLNLSYHEIDEESIRIGARKPFLSPPEVDEELEKEKSRLSARLSYQNAERALIRRVISGYQELFRAERVVNTLSYQLEVLQDEVRTLEREAEAGRRSRRELLDKQEDLRDLELDLDDARSDLDDSRRDLALLMGRSRLEPGEQPAEVPDLEFVDDYLRLDESQALSLAETMRDDFLIEKLTVQLKSEELQSASALLDWEVGLEGAYHVNEDNYQALFWATKPLHAPDIAHDINEVELDYERALLSLESKEKGLETEITSTLRRLQAAERDVERNVRNLERAEQDLEAARREHGAGLIPESRLRQFEFEIRDQEYAVILAEYSRILAIFEWMSVLGLDPLDAIDNLELGGEDAGV